MTHRSTEQLELVVTRMPQRLAGVLCLDLANTVEPRTPPPSDYTGPLPVGWVRSFVELLAWGLDAGVLNQAEALRLAQQGERRPEQAQAVFGRAIALREALYGVFWRIAQGKPPLRGDLGVLEQEHTAAAPHATLIAGKHGMRWGWRIDDHALDRVLWHVARSAAELLIAGAPERIKMCPGAPGQALCCAWLFFDESKNRNRHWCSMDDCGKLAKVHSRTARRRAARAQMHNEQ